MIDIHLISTVVREHHRRPLSTLVHLTELSRYERNGNL